MHCPRSRCTSVRATGRAYQDDRVPHPCFGTPLHQSLGWPNCHHADRRIYAASRSRLIGIDRRLSRSQICTTTEPDFGPAYRRDTEAMRFSELISVRPTTTHPFVAAVVSDEVGCERFGRTLADRPEYTIFVVEYVVDAVAILYVGCDSPKSRERLADL